MSPPLQSCGRCYVDGVSVVVVLSTHCGRAHPRALSDFFCFCFFLNEQPTRVYTSSSNLWILSVYNVILKTLSVYPAPGTLYVCTVHVLHVMIPVVFCLLRRVITNRRDYFFFENKNHCQIYEYETSVI